MIMRTIFTCIVICLLCQCCMVKGEFNAPTYPYWTRNSVSCVVGWSLFLLLITSSAWPWLPPANIVCQTFLARPAHSQKCSFSGLKFSRKDLECWGNVFNTGKVNCGGHKAVSCSKCPCSAHQLSYGKSWCNNDCQWQNNACKTKPKYHLSGMTLWYHHNPYGAIHC